MLIERCDKTNKVRLQTLMMDTKISKFDELEPFFMISCRRRIYTSVDSCNIFHIQSWKKNTKKSDKNGPNVLERGQNMLQNSI